MAELRIPRYLIVQQAKWGGWRPEKKVALDIPVPYKPSQGSSGFIPASQAAIKGNLPEIKGFADWEYRFWAVELSTVNGEPMTECRCCRSVFGNTQSRRAHGAVQGCFKKLTNAYDLLLKDMVCPICNMRSYKSKWGVPLCSPACSLAWCAAEAQPDALTAALQLVGDGK